MDKILQHLGGKTAILYQGCTRDVLKMRLVCKAWRAACSEYSGTASVHCKQRNDLQAVCKILPGLRGLRVETPADGCITALSSLSGLSKLELRNNDDVASSEVLDLTCLPINIKNLSLDYGFSYKHIHFVGLTTLSISPQGNKMQEVIALLRHLPSLQVRPPLLVPDFLEALSVLVLCAL